jgi:hypothetical protein
VQSHGIPAGGCFRDFNDYSTLRDSLIGGGFKREGGAHAMLGIDVLGGPIRIYRSSLRVTPLPVTISFTDSIAKIKGRIEEIERIPIARQRLFYADDELADELLLADLRPNSNPMFTNFRLVVIDPIRISIQTWTDDAILLEVNQDDRIFDVKGRLEVIQGIVAKEQRLFVGWREFDDADTLRARSIEDDFTLHLRTGGSRSDNNCEIARNEDLDDPDNPILHVSIHHFERNVIRSITVRRNSVLRDAIAGLGWIEGDGNPNLWFSGLRLNLKKIFEDYGIRQRTVLHFGLEYPIEIFVELFFGKHATFYVSLDDKVEVLRGLVEPHNGWPTEELRLIFGGHQMEDGCTLRKYCLEKDSTVHSVGRLR